MKYVYVVCIVIACLFVSHLCTYDKGFKAGRQEAYVEYQGDLNEQMQAVAEANKKIVDFQKKNC